MENLPKEILKAIDYSLAKEFNNGYNQGRIDAGVDPSEDEYGQCAAESKAAEEKLKQIILSFLKDK